MTPDETFTMLANARLATQLEQMRRERDEARAKLARIRDETVRLIRDQCECMTCYQHRGVLRIIDEKEGGQ